MRLGWLLVPPHLVDEVAAAKVLADRGSAVIDQLTFADFLNRGEFDRHLRRMRCTVGGAGERTLRVFGEPRLSTLIPTLTNWLHVQRTNRSWWRQHASNPWATAY